MTERSRPHRYLLAAATVTLWLATFAATTPAAAQREVYVGFGLGLSDVGINTSDAFDQVLDGDENSRMYEVGYRFSDHFAVEAAYYDLSEVDGEIRPCAEGVSCSDIAVRGKINALSLAIVPQYAITGRIVIFAKVGIVSWGASLEDAADDLNLTLEDIDDEALIYGVGAEFQLLGRLKAVGRIESIGGDIETLSVGIRFAF